MKTNLFILTILAVAFGGFQKTNEVNISGKICGKIPDEIYYSVPINGVTYVGFRDTIKPDLMGNFHIKIFPEKSVFVQIWIPGITSKKIVVEPGKDFNISINTDKESESVKISGANEAGQNLYNTLPNPSFMESEARKFANDPSIDSVIIKISALKAAEISRFQGLLNKNEISKTFFDLISVDRACYYAALTATIPLLNFYRIFREDPVHLDSFPQGMKKMWEDVYLGYPLNQKNLMYSIWWFEYAKTYVNCKEFLSELFTVQNLKKLNEKGLIHTHNIEEARKYLTGQELEYYEAAYIFIECCQKKFEKEFIAIFEQFKTDFPTSKYTKYLTPGINQIIEYHNIAKVDFDENIRFIPNYENICSLKETADALKGKKIYVDVWATWCGPCKSEFKNKKNLMKILKSKGIEILYISIDTEERDKQWKEMIKFYNLEGNHIRANKQLNADLVKIYNHNNSLPIPWYILIDEKGKIVKEHAKRPSDLEALQTEISEM